MNQLFTNTIRWSLSHFTVTNRLKRNKLARKTQ
jgi:hypothetical protein